MTPAVATDGESIMPPSFAAVLAVKSLVFLITNFILRFIFCNIASLFFTFAARLSLSLFTHLDDG